MASEEPCRVCGTYKETYSFNPDGPRVEVVYCFRCARVLRVVDYDTANDTCFCEPDPVEPTWVPEGLLECRSCQKVVDPRHFGKSQYTSFTSDATAKQQQQ
jgi:hypothetical protein